jgi:predicted ester cyclase
LLDPALVFYSPLFPDGVKGIEARKKTDENFLKSLPDFQFTILRMASKEGFVASELVGSGTSTGPAVLPGRPPIPPTGRRVEFRLGGFFNLNSKGLINEERYIYDRVVIIQGLGLNF